MRHHSEAFIGIDTSKSRNAVAIAEGVRGGEVRFLGEFPATEAAMRKLVAKLAAKYMCLACWCSHCSRLLALMWFARWVLIISLGSTPVTRRRFSRLDARPINIMPSAPPQP